MGTVSLKTVARFLAHSSKVAAKSASSRSASAGGTPFSRMQWASTSLVEATNEIDGQTGRPLLKYRRCSIHCRPSLANPHLPETANCRSAMTSPPPSSQPAEQRHEVEADREHDHTAHEPE